MGPGCPRLFPTGQRFGDRRAGSWGPVHRDLVLPFHRTRCSVPDVFRILCDGAIARELPGGGNVQDGFARPSFFVRVQFTQARVSFAIAFQVSQVKVVVALAQDGIQDRLEYAGLVPAEVVLGDEVERGSCLGVILVMPLRIVKTATISDFLRTEPE